MLIPVTRTPSFLSRTFFNSFAPTVTSLQSLWNGYRRTPIRDTPDFSNTDSGTAQECTRSSGDRQVIAPQIFSLYGMRNTERLLASAAVHYLMRRNISSSAGIKELLDHSEYTKPNNPVKNPRKLEKDDQPCLLINTQSDGFIVADEQSLEESTQKSASVAVITPICVQTVYCKAGDDRGLVLSEFGRIILHYSTNGFVFNPATSRLINGDKVASLIQLGAKLEKIKLLPEGEYLYHPKSNEYVKKEDAAVLMEKGEIFIEPDDFYRRISWSKSTTQ